METRRAVAKDGTEEALPLSSLRLLAPPLRLVSAAVWQVMKRRDVLHYGKLEEFVTSVSETVPELLSQRHKAKLVLGLKARLVLEMCRGQTPPDPHVILPHLEQIQNPIPPDRRKNRKDSKVETSISNFHELVKTLLNDPAQREHFFQEVFPVEYGPQFEQALEKLLWEFLTRLDQLLPVPDLAQTVSWLSSSPAVLEECARSVSQPELLRSLLQHHKCLGHLDVPGNLPSTLGDSILLSMSLPPSGRVQRPEVLTETSSQLTDSCTKALMLSSDKYGADAGSPVQPVMEQMKRVELTNTVSADRMSGGAQRTARGAGEESQSVIDSSGDQEVKLKSGSHFDKTGEEDDGLGKMMEGGEIQQKKHQRLKRKREQDEEDNDGDNSNHDYSDDDVRSSFSSGDDTNAEQEEQGDAVNGQQKKRGVLPETPVPQQHQQLGEEERLSLIACCMSHQPRVVIRQLSLSDTSIPVRSLLCLPGDRCHSAASPEKKDRGSPECKEQAVAQQQRRRNRTVMPRKQLLESFDKENCADSLLTLSASPAFSQRSQSRGRAVRTPEEDDIVFDSEDESTKNFKGRLFLKRYYRTKHNTYVPTLREFWKPSLSVNHSLR
uniref:TERF1 (TRF1)-interacting nuclear factor 2 n=1 Tax=Scleropages formosus TaxID=113540 RepID=A0A8C9QZ69_SCLFO